MPTIDDKYLKVKNIIEIGLLGFTLTKTIKEVFADKKISWVEYLDFLKPVKLIPAAITDIDQIDEELNNPESTALLTEWFSNEFSLPNNQYLEVWIQDAVKVGLELYRLASTFPKK